MPMSSNQLAALVDRARQKPPFVVSPPSLSAPPRPVRADKVAPTAPAAAPPPLPPRATARARNGLPRRLGTQESRARGPTDVEAAARTVNAEPPTSKRHRFMHYSRVGHGEIAE
jgi:hypothetical protein